MSEKISPDDLQQLLAGHLKGTVLEPLTERKDYVTGPDGFVAAQTIDRLCSIFEQAIHIHTMPNPRRLPGVAGHVQKIRQAIEAIKPFGTIASAEKEKQ
jgi:hypothetical protein